MSKILKNPTLQKEVYNLKHVLLEELHRLHISIGEDAVQDLAEKIFEESRHQEEEFFLHAEEEADSIRKKAEEEAKQMIEEAEQNVLAASEKIKMLEEEQAFQSKLLKESQSALDAKRRELESLSNTLEIKQNELKACEQKKKDVEAGIKNIEEQGFQAGLSRGRLAGVEEGKKEVLSHFAFINDLLAETQRETQRILDGAVKQKEEILQRSEEELVSLSLEIAKKVVRQEIQLNPTVVLSIARDALQKVLTRAQVHVKANPKDVEILTQFENELRAMLPNVTSFQITADESLGAGGVVIDTESGRVDARITRQFHEVEKSITAGN